MRHCELMPSVDTLPELTVRCSKHIGSSSKNWRVTPLMLRRPFDNHGRVLVTSEALTYWERGDLQERQPEKGP
jgi:hypothetical protein